MLNLGEIMHSMQVLTKTGLFRVVFRVKFFVLDVVSVEYAQRLPQY